MLNAAHDKQDTRKVPFTSLLYSKQRKLARGELENNKNRDKHQR